MGMKKTEDEMRHYFVDESGDGVIFDGNGRVKFEDEPCFRFFMLGFAYIKDPIKLTEELNSLRNEILSDEYLNSIPSVKRSTAKSFHAKNDIPEVREKVFKILKENDIEFYAAIRDKRKLLGHIQYKNSTNLEYRYSQNELYDYMVMVLFRDKLHKAKNFVITFARRGKADRNKALHDALKKARCNFRKKWGKTCDSPIAVKVESSERCAGLQVADYFLWALQRLFNKHEDRFFKYLKEKYHLVRDLDDSRNNKYGEYYNETNTLTLEKIKARDIG